MSHFLSRLVQRTHGGASIVRPMAHAVTAPDPAAAAWDEQVMDREAPRFARAPSLRPGWSAIDRLFVSASHPPSARLETAPSLRAAAIASREARAAVASLAGAGAGAGAAAAEAEAEGAPETAPPPPAEAPGEPMPANAEESTPMLAPLDAPRARPRALAAGFASAAAFDDPVIGARVPARPREPMADALPRAADPAGSSPPMPAPAPVPGEPLLGEPLLGDPPSDAPPLAGSTALAPPLARATALAPRGHASAELIHETTTTVEVSIGRIEIRLPARPRAPAEPSSSESSRPAVGLAEYLRARDGGKAP